MLLSSLPVSPTVNGAAFCATVVMGLAGGVMEGGLFGATPCGVIEKSSMARPSSAPDAARSDQRIQNVLPGAIESPVIVIGPMTVRSAAALPFLAPVVAVS